MNKAEIGELLTTASVLDGREVTGPMVNLWLDLIGHLDAQTAHAALRAHLQESTYKVQPANIIAQARAERVREQERRGVHPLPPPGKRWAADVIEYDPSLAIDQ